MFEGLGHQSELRDQQKRSTGRRHQPREMTTERGEPMHFSQGSMARQRQDEAHRKEQVQAFEKGSSFMDRMSGPNIDREHSTGRGAAAGRPANQLNLFSWGNSQDTPEAGTRMVMQGRRAGSRSEAEVQHLHQMDASAERDRESRKFEENNSGNFLRFSDAPPRGANGASQPGKRVTPNAPKGMLDNLMRDGEARRPLRRRGTDPSDVGGPEVQGFPGMGQSCAHRPCPRIPRKDIPSNIFVSAGDGNMDSVINSHSTSQRAHPQYTCGTGEEQRYEYIPAKGIVPCGAPLPPNRDVPPEWLQHSSLVCGDGGMGPMDDEVPLHTGKRIIGEEASRQQAEVPASHRTLLYQMVHERGE